MYAMPWPAKRTSVILNSYALILERLDLRAALTAGLERNDLLPPRPDDRAGGEVGERFIAALAQLMASGRYEADRAVLVPVPKPNYATRTAALLTAADRVVYHALVEPLRTRIERGLVSDAALLWPRAESTDKQWTRFEITPTQSVGDYIVLSDVSGFYESVDHDLLGDRLVALTGRTELVDALVDFLGQVMQSPRGLPQGLSASDALATAYLSPVDAGMLRHGCAYWRHGDDVRIAVADHDAGRLAVHRFENLLRSVRLLMNGDKTKVLLRETYQRHMHAVDDERDRVQSRLTAAKERAVLSADLDDEEVGNLVERAGIDNQTLWNLFYHRNISLEEIVEQLRPHLKPDDISLALATYKEAILKAPDVGGGQALGLEIFHAMLSSSLTTLIAAREATPLVEIASLVSRFPSETELLATYLRALASNRPQAVVDAATRALSAGYTTGWQQAWLFSVVRKVVEETSGTDVGPLVDIAVAIAKDEEKSWLARAEAARFLACAHSLSHELLTRLWASSPAAVRADLAAAVATVATSRPETEASAWAEVFQDSLREDPLLQVVLNRSR
jgi:hypothetical protein